MKRLIFVPVLLLLVSCGGKGTAGSTGKEEKAVRPQLNITMLLDLSDRIDPVTSPEIPAHHERDIANIGHITDLFVKDMASRGTFMSRSRMKVIFSPRPGDANVNILAEKLNVDLSKMDNRQKKEVYDSVTDTFADNLKKIYELAISEKKWIGSDVWRFFKNDVKDYCIQPDCRNILIIFTDGYIYHADSKDRERNRYAYLLQQNIGRYRGAADWEQRMERDDFGLIARRTDLEDIEILVLEVSPSPKHRNDEDMIKKVLSKWFEEMNVKRYAIFNSDLPEYTGQRIDDFIN